MSVRKFKVWFGLKKMAELSEEGFRELLRHAIDGHTEIVLEAVDRDRGLLARADQNGYRLLHRAANWGRADLVGALLDRGADIHARDNDGMDALMYACYSDDADLAFEIYKGLFIEILGIDNRAVNVREDLKFVCTTNVIAIA